MISRDVLTSDLDLARVLMNYLSKAREALIEQEVSLQEILSVEEYVSLLAVMYVIKGRAEGLSFDEAVDKADEMVSMDVAETEALILKANPLFRSM